MKKLLLFSLLLASTTIFAQYTLIPDINFEKKLISMHIDSGEPDGQVLTSSINTMTGLSISYSQIADLTGIEGFVNLQYLDCFDNQLTVLDVSKNTALKSLNCCGNQLTYLDVSKNIALENLGCCNNLLTTLDVSKNTALIGLGCFTNQLTVLDVTKNIALKDLRFSKNNIKNIDLSNNTLLNRFECSENKLTSLNINNNTVLLGLDCSKNFLTTLDVSKNTLLADLYCDSNSLTTLDVSKNTALTFLNCSFNLLTELNVKNTNNLNFEGSSFTNNPNLTCIQVDDKSYSESHWADYKDATASYSENCSKLSNNEVVFANVSLFPNPTKGQLHINNIAIDKVTIYTFLGAIVKTQNFDGVTTNNILNLTGLSKGIYMVAIKSNENVVVKKVVVE